MGVEKEKMMPRTKLEGHLVPSERWQLKTLVLFGGHTCKWDVGLSHADPVP